jgi:hypothetical protein
MNIPAFPTEQYNPSIMQMERKGGMTLRDYFAAKAMQAIVSRGIVNEVPLEIYATNAYKMADAMLKAKEA